MVVYNNQVFDLLIIRVINFDTQPHTWQGFCANANTRPTLVGK